jgi:hypothetical protein
MTLSLGDFVPNGAKTKPDVTFEASRALLVRKRAFRLNVLSLKSIVASESQAALIFVFAQMTLSDLDCSAARASAI